MKRAVVIVAALLSGCVSGGVPLTGPTPSAFMTKSIGKCPWMGADGSATQLTDTVAVTAAHADWLFGAKDIPGMDAAVFAHANEAPKLRDAVLNEPVHIYGAGCGGDKRFTTGRIVWLNATYDYRGKTVHGFAYTGDFRPGYSGGSVIADSDGAVLGMTPGSFNSGPILDKAPGEPIAFAYYSADLLSAIQ